MKKSLLRNADFIMIKGEIKMKALSRLVFCQYKLELTPFNTSNSKFTGSQTIYEISNYFAAGH